MTRIHRQDGSIAAVTVLKCEPLNVLGQRTTAKDGYSATIVQSGKTTKETQSDKTKLEDFTADQLVKIVGVTKGKGFSGTVKRHGFSIGPKSHGSHNMRAPGSIGSGYPQRVVKGRPMPGRLGATQTTITTFVESVLDKENLLLVRGSVPGSRGTILTVEGVQQ
ncbi:MAG: 50S ribosomal protein L3 [bacterium]|nr:50S ribosomal protein L3 [bacterium]